MDEIVRQAMAKWPNVPAVYGWLALDRRGNWLLKGETIPNPQITAFINRNYMHDDAGRWFFQNGPQRVFVELACAPYVYRVPDHTRPQSMVTHTQAPVREVLAAWIDDTGTLLLETEHGIGSVHDQDLEYLLPCFVDATGNTVDEDTLEARFDDFAAGTAAALWFQFDGARVKIEPLAAAQTPQKFGFTPQPKEP
jgi:hypothetical protein